MEWFLVVRASELVFTHYFFYSSSRNLQHVPWLLLSDTVKDKRGE